MLIITNIFAEIGWWVAIIFLSSILLGFIKVVLDLIFFVDFDKIMDTKTVYFLKGSVAVFFTWRFIVSLIYVLFYYSDLNKIKQMLELATYV